MIDTPSQALLKKPLFYIWLPILVTASPYLAEYIGAEAWFYSESGLLEWMTVGFLAVAIGFAAVSLTPARLAGRYVLTWFVLLLLGAVYFAGEELSWGQHIFGWGTPEGWAAINDQQETNLHNLGFVFDQLPRAVMTIAIFIGGICYPLYRRWHKISDASLTGWRSVWPAQVCLPTAVLVLLTRPAEEIVQAFESLPRWMDISNGELKECLIALFILIYIMALRDALLRGRLQCTS